MSTSNQITSPEDQSATFIELFFDLVFVFAITQMVSLFHDGISWLAVGHAVVLFWMVWWAWTQFTWSLNAADTTHAFIEVGTLLATALAFFMAISLPDAFGGRALWFAIPYVLVRIVGLRIYLRVAAGSAEQERAVRQFGTLSIGGMVAVLLGAYMGGETQYALWGLAMLLDGMAAKMAADTPQTSDAWGLHPEHFAERHGLIVIIALGETLIVAAAGLTGVGWGGTLLWVGMLAVVVSCALWWSYFARARLLLEEALVHSDVRAPLGRDVYSLGHFPMMLGVVGFAVALEEGIHHPSDPLEMGARLALGVGVALFVGGMGVNIWRATGRVLVTRFMIVVAMAVAVALVPGPNVLTSLGIIAVGLVLLAFTEQGSALLDFES